MPMIRSIDGVVVKQPSELGLETYNLTKSGRVASGKMTMDLVAKKRKFLFKYDVMSGDEYDLLTSVIDSNQMFFNLIYEDNGRVRSCIVYAGAIKRDRFRTGANDWYFKNVAFDLIEQ